jgi:hypothetical protein
LLALTHAAEIDDEEWMMVLVVVGTEGLKLRDASWNNDVREGDIVRYFFFFFFLL